MSSLARGEVVPMPTLPLLSIVNNDVPLDDATLNGLTPAEPFTLNVNEEDVALIPAYVPESRNRPVESAEADVHRAR